jgi:DNA-binding SARP family transcriptional activator
MTATPLQIEMFGGLRIYLPGQTPVEMPPQQVGALLAYLALHPARPHTREELAEIFWPEEEPETARHSLRQALHLLRRQVEKPSFEQDHILLATRTTVRLNPALIRTDVTAFEEAFRAAVKASDSTERIRLLSEAVRLYRGELLPGYYQDVFVSEQRRLSVLFRKVLNRLREAHAESGDLEQALECARRAVALDTLSEEAHCALMRLYAETGQPSAVLSQFREMEHLLKEGLGVAPSAETYKLVETLHQIGQAKEQNAHKREKDRADTLPFSHAASSDSVLTISPPGKSVALRPRWTTVAIAALALSTLLLGWIAFRPRQADPANILSTTRKPAPVPAAQEIWVRRYQPASDELSDGGSEPTAMVTDTAGNIYITGFVRTAKNDVDFLTLKYSPEGALLWHRRYNGPGNDVDRARSIAVDRAGNVYVTGESDNGKGNGTSRLSGLDFATIKYDSSGNELWVRRYNPPFNGQDVAVKVGLDDAGNVYVAGRSERAEPISGKPQDCFAVLKYDTNGNRKWEQRYEPEPGQFATLADMQVDGAGNVYVTGTGGNGKKLVGNLDYLTIKYDINGSLQWSAWYGGKSNGNDTPAAVALDPKGNVYVTGTGYNGDFVNGGTGTNFVTVKYDPRGNEQWVRSYLGGGEQKAHALAVDSAGNVYVTGETVGGTNYLDYATVKYDTNGVQQWAKQYNGLRSGNDASRAIAVDNAGQVFVTGETWNGHPVADAGTAEDYATLKYDALGNCLWLGLYNGPANGTDSAKAIVIDIHGDVIVTGQSDGGKANVHSHGILTIKYKP